VRTPTKAIKISEAFTGYMRVRRYALELSQEDSGLPQASACNVLSAPGHNVSLVAVLLMHPDGRLEAVLKAGDARPARVLRGEPYVKLGAVGGRWDAPGDDPATVARREVHEELGAQVVDGGLVPLGEHALPTMPGESTECDRYFVALSRLPAGVAPQGDGGGMELPGLIRPARLPLVELFTAEREGKIGEAGRVRVAYVRALDRLGYIPALGKYIFELPESLQKRYDTLGLGAQVDLRKLGEAHPAAAAPAAQTEAAQINDVKLLDRVNTHLEEAALLVNARVAHAVRKDGGLRIVGRPFRIQFLHVPYDRVKLAVWARDEARGPLVLMEAVERLPMAVKGMMLADEFTGKERAELGRLDLLEARMHVGVEHRRDVIESLAEHAAEAILMARGLAGEPKRLGSSVDASPGQSDLRYHYFHLEVPLGMVDSRFIPLAQAIRNCRAEGHGDANTEALLTRLAEQAGWLPTLGMSVAAAKAAADEG
jgi:8-oxo-dGTP pyrophosphatase MutT (NUDIX family)